MGWFKAIDVHGLLNQLQNYGLVIVAVLMVVVVVRLFSRNEDLREHSTTIAVFLGLLAFAPVLCWLIQRLSGNRFYGILCAGIFGAVVLWVLLRVTNRAVNDFLGGLLFDMVFSQGSFAERILPRKKLPNLLLLQHWRKTGEVRQAYRAARRGLIRRQDAYALWLFTAETAAVNLKKPSAAVKLIRKLCRADEFTDAQKTYAVNQLKTWAANGGFSFDEQMFRPLLSRPPKEDPLKEVARFREQGDYRKAKNRLLGILRHDPENLAVIVLLVRVYAQDLQQRNKAEALIASFEKQSFASRDAVAFLRNSLEAWLATPKTKFLIRLPIPPASPMPERGESAAKTLLAGLPTIAISVPSPTREAAPPRPERSAPPISTENLPPHIGALVEAGCLGTAVEELQKLIQQDPEDLGARLHLAQVHILHCQDRRVAERVIREILRHHKFTPEQKALAASHLEDWLKIYVARNPLLTD